MSNKKYRLLKDLPYIMAGVVYVKADGFNGVHDRCSYVPDKMGMMHERFALHSDWVEDNPDWFQEVVEPFVWTDELVKEFVLTYNKVDKLITGVDPIGQTIREWKQSKQPSTKEGEEVVEPERAEVREFWYECASVKNGFEYCFEVSVSIPSDKFPAIKQVIEAVLNGEVLYSIEDVRGALHGEWGTENAVGAIVNRLKNYKK